MPHHSRTERNLVILLYLILFWNVLVDMSKIITNAHQLFLVEEFDVAQALFGESRSLLIPQMLKIFNLSSWIFIEKFINGFWGASLLVCVDSGQVVRLAGMVLLLRVGAGHRATVLLLFARITEWRYLLRNYQIFLHFFVII